MTPSTAVDQKALFVPAPTKRPPPHKHEKRLSQRDQNTLEAARQGKRDPETMAGWTFRFGLHGLSGRRCVQVKPWGCETWLWVDWCTTKAQLAQVAAEKVGTGFDRL